MAMTAGAQLGSYEILALLGVGGMGEVYRAHDTKLNREVALKVLPSEFASDPERMGRFKREAQLLASLNHPNIAAIYGLEECAGVRALVMELAEGPTLAERISRDRSPIPLEEALPIARQIAEALEAAHEKGIIHRDLKPANIKVTPEGTVKVLDFGLAKALEGDGEAVAAGGADSPTLSLAATQAGVLLGTAAYMSPEQARGGAVDKRCDIWSFGVVLFEMLAGKKVFAGETNSDTLAAVLRSEIDWNLLPRDTPSSIRTLLRRCLTKDRKQRLQAIGEARIAIAEYLDHPADTADLEPVSLASRSKLRLAWGVSFLLLVAALALGVLYFRQTPVEAPETRFEVMTPPTSSPASLALSPDGRRLVFVASAEGQARLWLRPLDQVTAQPLAGSEGASYPFWSPDSGAIGFFAGGKLKRVDIAGGVPQVLASASAPAGGTWNRDGVIVFAPTALSPLYRVPASGGEPVAITRLDPRQWGHRFPQFLPDGRHLLLLVWGSDQGIYLASLDSTETRRLVAADTAAVYAPPGNLLFMRQGTLVAQHFDAARGELAGDPVPVADSVASDSVSNIGGFSVSETGMLAYRVSGGADRRLLAWFDRTGKEIGTLGAADENDLLAPELSPDARRVAVNRTVQGNTDVWLIDAARGVPSRFTFDPAFDGYPIWSPDGSRIVFASSRKGSYDIYQKPSNGAGNDELLLRSSLNKYPNDWSPDGRFLLYMQMDPKTGFDLWVLPLFGERKPFPYVNTSFNENVGQFSPDGRWVAYESDESGRFEVYVQPFPGPGGKWQVSTGGGIEPRWRRDGKELLYIAPDGKLMAVPIQGAGQTLEAGAAVALFQTRIEGGGQYGAKQQYAVAPDGQRFLINITADESTASPITIVTNWARTLKK
jgi:serine/threonine protein kinase/dipeptidyl aminopeptidase/acylaminoacyl peptidase